MRQKLFKKYFLATAATILVSLTIMMLILSLFYNRYLSQEKYGSLKKTCTSVSDYITAATADKRVNAPDRGLYYIMNNLAQVSNYDIMITDNDGVVMSCVCSARNSDGSCPHIGKKLNKKIIETTSKKPDGRVSTLDVYETSRYVCAVPLVTGNIQRGYIVATTSSASVKSLMKRVAKIYFLSAALPLLLMFFALYAMNYKMTKPLKLMSQAAHSMAKGDFSKRIPITSDDEIGELAVSFNQMTDALVRLEETRKDFVANVSHELKTPMTSIGGFIDGIRDGTIPPKRQDYYLGLVSDEIHRLSRMVEGMLNIAKLESKEFALKISQFDFGEMVLNIVIGQEQRIEERGFEIKGLQTVVPVTVNADKDLIYRAIYNLVDNAVKFTDQNGTITFDLKVESKALIFRIENTGKGIPENELPFVFDRFYKGDKSRSAVKDSTGLGLYIVKTIIKNHGGTITVSSAQNKFTAFEITLPLAK